MTKDVLCSFFISAIYLNLDISYYRCGIANYPELQTIFRNSTKIHVTFLFNKTTKKPHNLS